LPKRNPQDLLLNTKWGSAHFVQANELKTRGELLDICNATDAAKSGGSKMKPNFCHLAHEVMENIDELYPTKKGPLDIKTAMKKSKKESRKILNKDFED
jgi:hypothetical protein